MQADIHDHVEDDTLVPALHARIATLEDENARLWRSYEMLKEELALVKRRMFVARAERVDTRELQLEFEALLGKLDQLAGESPAADGGKQPPASKPRNKPTGRRKLEETALPVVPIEISDPLFEELVAQGKAQRMSTFEESSKLMYERGGLRRVVMQRVKYFVTDATGETARGATASALRRLGHEAPLAAVNAKLRLLAAGSS
jgi:transposase